MTTGARQFVVQLALLATVCLAGSYCAQLTPRTKVGTSFSLLVGAEMRTRFAPAARCFAASSPVVKRPVD